MKIAILMPGSYPFSGSVVLGMLRKLEIFEPMLKHHNIHIFVFGKMRNKNFEDRGFYMHTINLPLSGIPKIGWFISRISINHLLKRLKENGSFGVIFSYYVSDINSYLVYLVSKKLLIPLFSDYNDLETHHGNAISKIIVTTVYKKIFKNSLHIFPVSHLLKDRLINFYKIPEERITVIPNGVNTDKFNPVINGSRIRKKYDLLDSLVIGYCGSLDEWVRLDILLKAVEQIRRDYKNIKLLIVGIGSEMDKLKRLSKKLGIENEVIFTGLVPHNQVPEYIASFDIAVAVPSKSLFTDVASPLKVAEYLSMGKAVVADNLSGTREFIKNKENGILFVPEDAKSLENAIRVILDDEILRSELEKNARKTALNYDWKILSKRMEEIMIENL